MQTDEHVKVTPLSGGWYMTEPMTRSMAAVLYNMLDDEEYEELRCVEMTREDFVNEAGESEHSAAFWAGPKLVFGVCANWVDFLGGRKRIWDTMSTKTIRNDGLTMAFVKHTPEMLDAFFIGEPTDEVYGVVKSDFERSRKWVERCAGFEEVGTIGINNHWNTVYKKKWRK